MVEYNQTSVGVYSEIDANCTAAVPNGAPSGMFPNQCEPVWRAMMGATQRWWNRSNGTVTTTGASGHYIYTPSNTAYPTAYVNGEEFSWKAHQDSASGDDLNINSLGAKPLYKITSSGPAAIAAGDIKTSARIITQYDSTLNSGSGAHLVIAGLVQGSSIGLYVSSSVLVGSAVALTSGVATNITSISLTAGDWDVDGSIGFTGNSATIFGEVIGGASTTSAALPSSEVGAEIYVGAAVSNYGQIVLALPTQRMVLGSTTTVYLVEDALFSVSTAAGFGLLRARRMG